MATQVAAPRTTQGDAYTAAQASQDASAKHSTRTFRVWRGDASAAFARQGGAVSIDSAAVEQAQKDALAPFERGANAAGEGPYQVQYELQGMMQDLVGIVRREDEMKRALEGIARLRQKARTVGVAGNREYNPGWHTALDLANLLTVSEAIARAAIDRKESRGGHFRDDYPEKSADGQTYNLVVTRGQDGGMELKREPIRPLPPELGQIIEEQK